MAIHSNSWTTWPAPAKLNLFLHIVGRRADGYHLLQSVFQLLDWGDDVQLRVRTDGLIERSDDGFDMPEGRDLCLRAARALRRHTRADSGAGIRLRKRIPVGGGLGGGSSDAATVLVALNELWNTGLQIDELAAIGIELGADVPVFIHGRSAWAEGVGERLTAIAIPPRDYVIVDPGVAVATALLFQAPELTRNSPQTTISGYLFGSSVETVNAFEPVVRARYPQVAAALDWLGRFGKARLTGSGGCVFAEVESTQVAEEIVSQCPREFSTYRARGVAESPLRVAVARFRADSR
ncbi:MAG TPA: 4-(cytidine 5'-diphospho)-2-C-methyl-D-erythritol kinase [Rudaea sp.]|jgi:4-diphosphocytidyl-2-C-methyl-D-erythritol kinase